MLKKDHQEAKHLFSQIETEKKNGDSREKLLLKLKNALEVHSEAKEEVFYVPLRKNEVTKAKIEHATKEHEKVKRMLDEIEAMDPNDESWLTKVTK